MKAITIICMSILLPLAVSAQKAAYDSTLAKSLKADDYGMKTYVFVMLKSGSNKSADKAAQAKAFEGHMNNIKKMSAEGMLAVAGPFDKGGEHRGIFILDVSTIEAAKKLLEGDTAIKEKYLEPELILWYGSAALMEVPKIHEKIQKESF